MTDRMRPLFVLLGALALGACDGGIFGTGDGSPSTDLLLPTPVNAAESPADSGAAPGGTEDGGAGSPPAAIDGPESAGVGNAGDTDGMTSGAEDALSAEGDAPDGMQGAAESVVDILPLENLVPEGSDGRLVRLVNASDSSLALSAELEDGTDDEVPSAPSSGPIVAGDASGYVTLPPGTRSLTITSDADRPDARGTTSTLVRFVPLALAPNSVTTIFLREPSAANGSAPDIVSLPTRVTSEDPAQALVRVVVATGPVQPRAVHRLVPLAGPNPGSAEVALEGVSFDRAPPSADSVAPAYVPVPVGEYRLARPDGAMVETTLSFAAGDVRTLVMSDGAAPPIVVNDSPP